MDTMYRSWARALRGFVAVTMVAIGLVAGGVSTASVASAAAPECAGRGVPTSKISVQLWTFAEYIGFGTDAGTIARTEEVFQTPERDGVPERRAVHPERADGRAVPRAPRRVRAQGLRAARRRREAGGRRLTSTRSLRTTRRWGSSTSAPVPPRSSRWSTPPRRSGSPTPSTSTSSARIARQHGQTLMVHNHDIEFEEVFGDQTVFDILMAYTDPKNVGERARQSVETFLVHRCSWT